MENKNEILENTEEKLSTQGRQIISEEIEEIDIEALEKEAANSAIVVDKTTVIDLNEELKKTTLKAGVDVKKDEETPAEQQDEDIYTADFLDASDDNLLIDDKDLIEKTDEVTNTWFNAQNLSGLIASAYQLAVPPLLVGGYKKIFFAGGEWEQIQKIKEKQSKLFKEKKNWNGTVSELELMDKFNTYLDYKEKKAPLTDEQIERLADAWEYQLNKWGFSNPNINIDKFLEAHVSILVEKGVDIGIDVAADKMK